MSSFIWKCVSRVPPRGRRRSLFYLDRIKSSRNSYLVLCLCHWHRTASRVGSTASPRADRIRYAPGSLPCTQLTRHIACFTMHVARCNCYCNCIQVTAIRAAIQNTHKAAIRPPSFMPLLACSFKCNATGFTRSFQGRCVLIDVQIFELWERPAGRKASIKRHF